MAHSILLDRPGFGATVCPYGWPFRRAGVGSRPCRKLPMSLQDHKQRSSSRFVVALQLLLEDKANTAPIQTKTKRANTASGADRRKVSGHASTELPRPCRIAPVARRDLYVNTAAWV